MRLLEQSFRSYSFAPQSFLCFAISAILLRVWVILLIQIILSYWVFVNYYFVNFNKNIFVLKQVLV